MINEKTVVQYLGHRATADAREYNFTVRGTAGPSREFSLSIPHAAFSAHRVRFQDAAEICSIRLHSELQIAPLLEPCSLRVTDADLDAYRIAHAPKKHTFASIRKKNPLEA